MKKIISIFAIVSLLVLQSCTTNDNDSDYVDNDTIAQAFEIKNADLAKVADNEYNISNNFNSEIGGDLYNNETLLVYRLTGTINSTIPIWQLIPRSINFPNGNVLEYYFDFSKVDFVITAYGNYNLLNRSEYIDNQTFRIVIVPTDLSASINKENYNEVIGALNIKENEIQKIQF